MIIPALILARGGSKGIVGKNLQEILGVSLIGRITREAIKSKFDPVFVWSDSEGIRMEADRYGAQTPERPIELSGDKTTTEEAVRGFLDIHDKNWKALAVLQCTTPFLKAKHMNRAFDFYGSGRLDSVVSGTRFSRYLGYPDHNGKTSFVPMRPYRSLRQEKPATMFMENGGIYLAGTHLWMKGRRIGASCGVVEMDWWESIEIDEPEDLQAARRLATCFLDEEEKPKIRWIRENVK